MTMQTQATDQTKPATFLEQFEEGLHLALDDRSTGEHAPAVLLKAARYLSFGAGAKRARPQLVHHFGEILGTPRQACVDVAISAELIHAASLMHDDVVDAGTMRRGQPTANVQWNNSVAVLSGDMMLCLSLAQLAPYPREVSFDAIELVADMTRAAMKEVESRGRLDLSLADWRYIAQGKTGALLGWCGSAPARISGRNDAVDKFHRCGHHLGMAFQLNDDLQDLLDTRTGKDRFADIINKSPSFPLIVAMQSSDSLRAQIGALWERDTLTAVEVERTGLSVIQVGAAQETREAIFIEIHAAIEALGVFGDCPAGAQIIQWARHLEEVARHS